MYEDVFFKQAPGLKFINEGAKWLAFNPNIPAWARVSKSAMFIMKRCDGNTSVSDLIDVLSAKFGLERTRVQLEVVNLLEKTLAIGLMYQDEELWAAQMRRVRFDRKKELAEYIASAARPKRIAFEVTNRCNLRCIHCFANGDPTNNTYLPTDLILNQLDDIANLGVESISFGGGEPLLHPDIWLLIEAVARRGYHIHISSNGTLIDKNAIEKLTMYGVHVQISIDGSSPVTHELIRGPHNFDRSLNATKNLINAGMADFLIWAFTPLSCNMHDIAAVARLATEVGVRKLRVNRLCNNGRASAQGLRSTEESMVTFYHDLHELRKAYSQILSIEGDFCEQYSHQHQMPFSNCPLCESLKIDPNGSVFPCAQFTVEKFSLGNIHHEKISQILSSNPRLKKMRSLWYERFSRVQSKCYPCCWRLICKGGCMAETFAEYNTIWSSDPHCAVRKKSIYSALFDAMD